MKSRSFAPVCVLVLFLLPGVGQGLDCPQDGGYYWLGSEECEEWFIVETDLFVVTARDVSASSVVNLVSTHSDMTFHRVWEFPVYSSTANASSAPTLLHRLRRSELSIGISDLIDRLIGAEESDWFFTPVFNRDPLGLHELDYAFFPSAHARFLPTVTEPEARAIMQEHFPGSLVEEKAGLSRWYAAYTSERNGLVVLERAHELNRRPETQWANPALRCFGPCEVPASPFGGGGASAIPMLGLVELTTLAFLLTLAGLVLLRRRRPRSW